MLVRPAVQSVALAPRGHHRRGRMVDSHHLRLGALVAQPAAPLSAATVQRTMETWEENLLNPESSFCRCLGRRPDDALLDLGDIATTDVRGAMTRRIIVPTTARAGSMHERRAERFSRGFEARASRAATLGQ